MSSIYTIGFAASMSNNIRASGNFIKTFSISQNPAINKFEVKNKGYLQIFFQNEGYTSANVVAR